MLCLPIIAQTPNPSCTNMGFEDGTFSGWCRKTGFFVSYSKGNGYEINYNNGETCNSDDIFDDVSYIEEEVVFEIDPITLDTISSNTISRLIQCETLRFEMVSNTGTDDYGINLANMQGNYAVKLGNTCVRNRVDRIEQTFTVSASNSVFKYNYAVALQDTGICGHIDFENLENEDCDPTNPPNPEHTIDAHTKPYFTVYLEKNGKKVECSDFLIFGDDRVFQFESDDLNNDGNDDDGVFVKQWQENALDLLKFVELGEDVTVVAEVGDCGLGGHFGYAYFEASCDNVSGDVQVSATKLNACINEEISFTSTGGFGDYFWTFYDNDTGDVLGTSFDTNAVFTYNEPGHYRVTYALPNTGTTGACFLNESALFIDIEDCDNTNEACEACESFSPTPGDTYWIGAWVKEEHEEQVISYSNSAINLVFSDADNQPIGAPLQLEPSGDIIDGWQRIIGEFTIPQETVYFNLNLINQDTAPVYFDDVRVHPINGNMKSFVYDPESYRLMAELDENNYTTFYEYDNEGGLVRVKKETTEGIMTIQETRSSNTKTNN